MRREQIELVESTWAQVAEIKEGVAQLFYAKLFELDPSVRPLPRRTTTRWPPPALDPWNRASDHASHLRCGRHGRPPMPAGRSHEGRGPGEGGMRGREAQTRAKTKGESYEER